MLTFWTFQDFLLYLSVHVTQSFHLLYLSSQIIGINSLGLVSKAIAFTIALAAVYSVS